MSKPLGYYHYEFIPARGKAHQWRVGDQDDDMVTDFPTRKQAREFVREHNKIVREHNKVGRVQNSRRRRA